MRNLKKGAFTLVELLVVITILAILSVVAYQSFGGVTDKAQNTTKVSNLAALGNTLGLFKNTENYYPMPQTRSDENLWGYSTGAVFNTSNYLRVEYDEAEIKSLTGGLSAFVGGGVIYGTGAWASGETDHSQIGAKGVLGEEGQFNKKYLPKEIYDTQLGDIALTGEDKKMIDYGIGKFSYAIYARPSTVTSPATHSANWNVSGTTGAYYELAATLKAIDAEGYTTYLAGDYSNDNFSGSDSLNYPESLMGLSHEQTDNNVASTEVNQGIPYAIDNFAR